MIVEQKKWTKIKGWETIIDRDLQQKAELVLVFGSRLFLESGKKISEIKKLYPKAEIVVASTAGEIYDVFVIDDSIIVTAIQFSETGIRLAKLNITDEINSYIAGKKITNTLLDTGLTHILVISDGHLVNGSKLVEGINSELSKNISVTGGLAGDGANFEKTVAGLNEVPASGNIIAIGFYGYKIKIGYGSVGGWDTFGPERLITRSHENILYELDGQSALDLYKKYLGKLAIELPASALLFPLSLKLAGNRSIVRTVLTVDEKEKSMTFAGDMPEGSYARLMKANFDRLIEGAEEAAAESSSQLRKREPELAILISCIGRKLVLDQRIEEEVENVKQILGRSVVMTGFYSYGEICPFADSMYCQLHNQTMTITTMTEK